MSHIASGILGTIAASLALGAVHLEIASGHDLLGPAQHGDAGMQSSDRLTSTVASVNRASKSDRIAPPAATGDATLAFRIQGVSDTSVLMRVSADHAAKLQRRPVASESPKMHNATRPIACEPPMSVLSTGAKQASATRCLT